MSGERYRFLAPHARGASTSPRRSHASARAGASTRRSCRGSRRASSAEQQLTAMPATHHFETGETDATATHAPSAGSRRRLRARCWRPSPSAGCMSGGGGTSRSRARARDGGARAGTRGEARARTRPSRPGQRLQEGERGADDEFLKHATPGDTVPAAAVQQALADWKKVKGRATGGKSDWKPLGPTDAQGLDNQYRDRAVYNAGTPDFSGRIAHVAIDPSCRGERPVHALDRERERRRLADEQRARRDAEVAVRLERASSTTTPPRSSSTRTTSRRATLWVGTGEPNACGSGCEAGVGIYYSKNAGNTLGRPARPRRASTTARSARSRSSPATRRRSSPPRAARSAASRTSAAAAPTRSSRARRTSGSAARRTAAESWKLVNQGAAALCTGDARPTRSRSA